LRNVVALGLSDCDLLVAAEIVEDHHVAGSQGRNQNALDIQAEDRAAEGLSSTQGASTRSWRRAAMKVRVRQCPCGTQPTSRWPRVPHPRSAAMLVLTQVSSRKTKRCAAIESRHPSEPVVEPCG
jgi:hypothetical protein